MMLMRKELPGGDTWPRVCDTCGTSPSRVYCRADGAYLCSECDARVHASNQVASRHERVWVCEACERSPAEFLCKADAASLCAACDADVHSANPLARRHQRVPILPLSACHYAAPGSKRAAILPMVGTENEFDEEDEDEAASWLLLNPSTNTENKGNKNNNTNGYFLGNEVDEYLDLVEYTSGSADNVHLLGTQSIHHEPHFDSVVPSGIAEPKDSREPLTFQMGLDFDIKTDFAYTNSSISQSVSVSSMDVGIVPDSTMSDVSTTIDLFSCPPIQQIPTQLSPMDRVARVLRYREKKKTRKFEKTIRYASRKAYAETRPRIKGRFAKRTEVDVQVDRMFPNSIMADGGYGIVPSF